MVNMLKLWWTCSIYGEHTQFMVNMLNLWWTCLIWMSIHIYFEISWFVQSQLIVPHNWIGLEKLPQNDPLNVQIRPLDPKIQWYLFWSQLICTVTADCASWLDWPWKTTPKWPFVCQKPSTGSKDTVIFILKSADLYSHSWFDLTFGFALKNYPLNVKIHPLDQNIQW